MAQITNGIRALLSHPRVYDWFQDLVGASNGRRKFVTNYVKPLPGMRVLDIGCGTAAILDFLPNVDYHGFDASEEYILQARARYGDRGSFVCSLVTDQSMAGLPRFDLALGIGILHHLDDDEGSHFMAVAKTALVPGGRLITMDPCYVHGQSSIARFVIDRDRGRNVRDEMGYERLARSSFSDVRVEVRHDMLRIPYTHAILVCTT